MWTKKIFFFKEISSKSFWMSYQKAGHILETYINDKTDHLSWNA